MNLPEKMRETDKDVRAFEISIWQKKKKKKKKVGRYVRNWFEMC